MATLSFHAGTEGKIRRNGIRGMTGHTLRKTEQRYKTHANESIDESRTHLNVDKTSGGKKLEEIVEERLKNEYTGKRKIREDAVVIREVIVQASYDVYEGLDDDAKRAKALDFTRDSLEWFKEEFGESRVVGLSLHMDETNPHTHVLIMPMTDDGRLSQKDFFKGRSDLKRQHREYREFMNERGWGFDMENKYGNVDSLSLPKYKANAKAVEGKRAEQKEMAEFLASEPDVRSEALQLVSDEIRAEVLREEQERLEARERSLEAREERMRQVESRFGEATEVERLMAFNFAQKFATELPDTFAKIKPGGLEKVYQVSRERDGMQKEVMAPSEKDPLKLERVKVPLGMEDHLKEAQRRAKQTTQQTVQVAEAELER